MYNNNNARFPLGDNGDELELIDMLTRGCRCDRENNSGCSNSCNNNNCSNGCKMPEFDECVALAIVYSPDHAFSGLYDEETALERATLFKNLDKPFMGMTVSGGNCK